jgi:hypothetical protein
MDHITIRAGNRYNSIDLILNERLAQPFRLVHTQTPEQLAMMTRRQGLMIVYRRRPVIGLEPALTGPHQASEGLIRGALVSAVPKGQRLTPVKCIISSCLKNRRKISANHIN